MYMTIICHCSSMSSPSNSTSAGYQSLTAPSTLESLSSRRFSFVNRSTSTSDLPHSLLHRFIRWCKNLMVSSFHAEEEEEEEEEDVDLLKPQWSDYLDGLDPLVCPYRWCSGNFRKGVRRTCTLCILPQYDSAREERRVIQKLTSIPSLYRSLPTFELTFVSSEQVEITQASGASVVLGSGTFSTVFLGRFLPSNRPVAIKAMYKKESSDNDVIREAAILEDLTMHCGDTTPVFYGLALLENHPQYLSTCLVMDFIGDELHYQPCTLDNFINLHLAKRYFVCPPSSLLWESDILNVLLELILKLKKIHSRNIIVNDIKADNVLMVKYRGTWHPYLVDLGNSKYGDYTVNYHFKDDDEADRFFTKYNQIDPDLQLSNMVSTASDVYSLGVMLLRIAECTRLQSVWHIGMACVQDLLRRPNTQQVLRKLRSYRNTALKADRPHLTWLAMVQDRARGQLECPVLLGGLVGSGRDGSTAPNTFYASVEQDVYSSSSVSIDSDAVDKY